MVPELRKILDTLPQKRPRSRLEPYREFIEELRRAGRTYRDISAILADKCQLKVTASGIHDFMRTRAQISENSAALTKVPQPPSKRAAEKASPAPSNAGELNRRIAALKSRSHTTKHDRETFQFDPAIPLRIVKEGDC